MFDIGLDSYRKKVMEISSLESLNEFLNQSNNLENTSYFSAIADVCKEYPCMLGIDEAGRGPVLGPMVYGIALCPINEATILEELGCADSKALTEEKRDKIFVDICKNDKLIGWGIEVIAPNSICNSMLSRSKYSLNQVSMDSAIGLIRSAIKLGVNIRHIYVDTVGPPEKYQSYLKSIFPQYDITVAKKADSTYPIVSAASICAKVTRDHALKVWEFQEGIPATCKDFGSGYPGDPTTKNFLADFCDPVFGFPQLVRSSWSTAENALESTAFFVEWEAIEDEKEVSPVISKHMSITSFFKAKSTDKPILKERAFLKSCCLTSKVEF